MRTNSTVVGEQLDRGMEGGGRMFYNLPLELNTEDWVNILSDQEVTTKVDFNILKVVFESKNYELTASEIASQLKLPHHVAINSQISRFSKRIVYKTGIQPPKLDEDKPKWWHIPFLGYNKNGKFPWIMRPELVKAFERFLDEEINDEHVYLDEVIHDEASLMSEGIVKQVFVNRYERNRAARNKCIEHYGSQCVICGFDFEEVYGPIGKNKIHVHHLVPLSKIKHDYKVNPIYDLRPVCPNCHLIIHSKKEAFTIEEVKNLLNKN